MKRIIPILLAFTSCGNDSDIKKSIVDHEQSFLDTKIDLSISFDEVKKIKNITERDSLMYYTDVLSGVEDLEKSKSEAEKFISGFESWDESTQNSSNFRNTYHQAKLLVTAAEGLEKFKDSDKVIAYEYEATFIAKNPMLNANQHIKSRYQIDASTMRVTSSDRVDINN